MKFFFFRGHFLHVEEGLAWLLRRAVAPLDKTGAMIKGLAMSASTDGVEFSCVARQDVAVGSRNFYLFLIF